MLVKVVKSKSNARCGCGHRAHKNQNYFVKFLHGEIWSICGWCMRNLLDNEKPVKEVTPLQLMEMK